MILLQIVWLALSEIPAAAQMPGTVIAIDLDNYELYANDVSDYTRLATNPDLTKIITSPSEPRWGLATSSPLMEHPRKESS
jgi:hypothetical protein